MIPASNRRALFIGACLAILGASPALTVSAHAGAASEASLSLAQRAAALRPNQFFWAEKPDRVRDVTLPITRTYDDRVQITVSIPDQKAYVYRGGTLIAVSTVSTGRPGHETPVGEFEILQKNVDHRSNLYNDAPMPFMQRLTWDGIALHAGHNPGSPASHGCIRLPKAFARDLYALTDLGGLVSVTDSPVLLTDPPVDPVQDEPTYDTPSYRYAGDAPESVPGSGLIRISQSVSGATAQPLPDAVWPGAGPGFR